MANFDQVFNEFRKHRKKLKKPMTDYAEHLILKKLDRLSNGHQPTAIAILEQSIEQGWQGVFPIRSIVSNCPQCGSANIKTAGNRFDRCYSCNHSAYSKDHDKPFLDVRLNDMRED